VARLTDMGVTRCVNLIIDTQLLDEHHRYDTKHIRVV